MSINSSTEEILDRNHDRRKIESELFSLEAEHSGMIRRRDEQGGLLKNLRHKQRLAESEVLEAEEELKAIETRILEKEAEISSQKKKLRLL